MFKAAAVVSDTKRVLKHLDAQGLAELRAMQKPDNEIEDLLAAIIIIGKYEKYTYGKVFWDVNSTGILIYRRGEGGGRGVDSVRPNR